MSTQLLGARPPVKRSVGLVTLGSRRHDDLMLPLSAFRRAAPLFVLGALATLAFASVTSAEPSKQSAIASTPMTKLIVHAADVKTYVVYEWQRDGVQHNAWPGDGQTPPADAAKLYLTLYNFPTGQARRIRFAEHMTTPWHRNVGQDALFYYLTAQQVEFVDGHVTYMHVGDASMHPEGVMHHTETVVPGDRLEYGFAPQGRSGHDPVAFSGRDMTLHQMVETVTDGRLQTMVDAGEPAPGATYRARLFQFPGYLMAEEHFPAGEAAPLHTAGRDTLLYVLSGRLKVTSGSEGGEVGAGDMVRMVAGLPFARRALEDSVVLEVDGSKAPPNL
jgi:quercetin dioxygenase-like cupin family protein